MIELTFYLLQLAAIIRELDSMHLLSEDSADHLMYKCSSKSLITTCAELLKIVPNPRGHPFMDILEVIVIHIICMGSI